MSAPRAVLYLRQSVSREDSISLELQETAGREHCARMGYEVVAVESDPGISGRTWVRPAVIRVMGMIEAGEADVIVLWKWSRLSRSRRDWAVALDRIESLGGRLESATEPVDTTTATGRFTRGMLAEMAAFESDRIGEVWREVHARRISHGLPSRGGERFGYRRTDDGGYVPDPVTGPLLAEALRRVADGHSLRSVVAWMNASGSVTLAGQPWTRDRLTRVLDSGFAAGMLVRQARTGGRVDRRLASLTWAPGAHPALVDADTWSAYLTARRLRGSSVIASSGVYLLSGLIRCGDCGAPMHADRLGREAGYAFVCSAWKAGRKVRCVSVARTRAEAAVLDWLGTVADEVTAATDVGAAVVTPQADVAALAREATRLESRQQRLLQGWLDGVVPTAAYEAERDAMTAAMAAVARQLDEAAYRSRESAALPSSARWDLLADWDLLPVEARRRALRHLVDHVEVVPPRRRGQRATVRVHEVA